MKKLLNGDAGKRSVLVAKDKKTATVEHCWKASSDSPRYNLKFVYNLDVPQAEIYRLAVLWINKDFQNRMRSEKLKESDLVELEKSPISVAEIYEKKERAPRDPRKAAANALEKLSEAERAEILARYMKEQAS